HGSPGRRRTATRARAGYGRLLLWRENRKARTEKIQDHERRLFDMRPADASLGPACRHGHPERRSLYVFEAGSAEGERRADALSADHVLPDQTRGSRDGLSDSQLRLLLAARAVVSQRVLLGDRSQP